PPARAGDGRGGRADLPPAPHAEQLLRPLPPSAASARLAGGASPAPGRAATSSRRGRRAPDGRLRRLRGGWHARLPRVEPGQVARARRAAGGGRPAFRDRRRVRVQRPLRLRPGLCALGGTKLVLGAGRPIRRGLWTAAGVRDKGGLPVPALATGWGWPDPR